MSPYAFPEFRLVEGRYKEGVSVIVRSTRLFSMVWSGRIMELYEEGKVGPGHYDCSPDKYEYCEVSIEEFQNECG